MLPQEFQRKWIASELKERSASQSHFNDLCAVLGVPTPTDENFICRAGWDPSLPILPPATAKNVLTAASNEFVLWTSR